MRAFLAVLEREIVERRLLFVVALLLGLVPLAMPLLPGFASQNPDDLRGSVALALSGLLALALALILGGTVIARDLAERRLGFYFARPVPGWSLWAGKLAAVLILIVSAGLLILAPAWLAGADLDSIRAFGAGTADLAGGVVTILGFLLLALLAAHVASVVLRARSPWLALDLAALAVVAWSAGSVLGRLGLAGAVGAVAFVTMSLFAAALLALLTASAAQVIQGRTDLRRSHRYLSLTLWPLMLAGVIAVTGFSRWVLAMEPTDLDAIYEVDVAPAGPWVSVHGMDWERAGYSTRYLIEAPSGRFVKARDLYRGHWITPLFSTDGRWAVWLEPQPATGGFEVARVRLRDPRLRPQRLAISFPETPKQLALSPGGSRLAALFTDRLTVDDLDAGRLLVSARLPEDLSRVFWARFGADGALRVYAWDAATLEGRTWDLRIWELDIPRGRFVAAGRLPDVENESSLTFSPDGLRLLDASRGLRLLDARREAVLATLPLEPGSLTSSASFLRDGRIVWVLDTGEDMELRLLASDLREIRRIVWQNTRRLKLGGEYAPGRLVACVAVRPEHPVVHFWEARRIDLATGEQQRFARGVIPAGEPGQDPASIGPRLFQRGSQLVWIDPETGRERVITGKPANS